MMTMAKLKMAVVVLAGIMVTAGGAVVAARAGSQVEQKPAPVAAADPLPAPVGELARPTWPAGGDLQLVQISVVVDAKVVEKLRTVGQRILNEGGGYEAIRIDPEMALHYLRMARKADLAYLPDSTWYRCDTSVMVQDMVIGFHYETTWGNWRGERPRLEIAQRLGTPMVHERRIVAGELRLDLPNVETRFNGATQSRDLRLRTKVAAGDGVVVVAKIGQAKAGEIWHLVLYQVIAATPEEVANYREMRDVVQWIEGGTAAEQKLVQQAVLWQEKAKATKLDPRWVKDLPGGTRVELLGVSSQSLNPYCWWTGDGRPAAPGYRRNTPVFLDSEQREASAWVSVSRPSGWFSRKADVSWYFVRQDRAIEVTTGSGPFKTVATLKPEVGQRVMAQGQPFAVQKISGSGGSCSFEMEYTFFEDLDVRVAAADGNGKEQEPVRSGFSGQSKTMTVPDMNVGFPVSLERIKELRVQVRPMYRVRFEGLALEPVESLPEPGEKQE